MEEKIKYYLSNLYNNYRIDTKSYVDKIYKAKCLGAMEALLVLLNKISVRSPYDYQKVKRKVKILFFWEITHSYRESYEEHILRLTDEVLNKNI